MNSRDINFDFIDLLNKENVKPLYTQLLNGLRIRNNDVVYAFDEVGCGKTVSAIIAMASLIKEKKNQGIENYKILVITPPKVILQFGREISEKLLLEEDVKVIILDPDRYISRDIVEKIQKENKVIVVSSPGAHIYHDPNKSSKWHLVSCQLDESFVWDLVVVDEAHKKICNNLNQTEAISKEEIDIAYNKLIGLRDNTNESKWPDRFTESTTEIISNYCKDADDYIRQIDDASMYLKKIYKYLFVESYNNFMWREIISLYLNEYEKERLILLSRISEKDYEESNEYKKCFREYKKYLISLPYLRMGENKQFKNICKLKSKKLMFLSATSYKYNMEEDYLNYAIAATEVLISTNNKLVFNKFLPQLGWLEKFYTGNVEDSFDEMKNSNTSLMFKEIALSLPMDYEEYKRTHIKGKKRNVELWVESEGDVLRNNIISILTDKKYKNIDGLKNRVIIFVSGQNEGKYVFDKLFPNSSYNIKEDINHKYTYVYEDEDGNKKEILCEFIMDIFENTHNLLNYGKEKDDVKIPDILIINYQEKQEGINLPTFNYVVNFDIRPMPADLEQRYGRVDRLTSKYSVINNIFYLDNNEKYLIYRRNLVLALYKYYLSIVNAPHNVPVKNLLLCEGIRDRIKYFYPDLDDTQKYKIDKALCEEEFGEPGTIIFTNAKDGNVKISCKELADKMAKLIYKELM